MSPSSLPLLLLLPSAEIVHNPYVSYESSHTYLSFISFSSSIIFPPVIGSGLRYMHAESELSLYIETPRITPVVISPIIHLRIRTLHHGPLLPALKAIYIQPDSGAVDFSSIILLASGAPLNVVELNNSAISERNFFIPFLSSLATSNKPPSPSWSRTYIFRTCISSYKSSAP